MAVTNRDLKASEINEYLVNIFSALLRSEKFRTYLNDNYIIRQYYNEDDDSIVKVEIIEKTPIKELN